MKYQITLPDDKGTKYEAFRYPAGELQVRLKPEELEAVSKADELELIARIQDGEVMELALLSDALSHAGNFKTAVLQLPYLPYARADRRFVLGDSFGLKTFGRFISTLGFDRIVTWDIHSPISRKFMQVLNVMPYFEIGKVVKELGMDLTILLPDKGAARYKLEDIGLPILQAEKIRDPQTGALSGFQVPKIGTEKILIVDDICDGGGTFIGIAKLLPEHKRYLYVTHGIFSKGFEELLKYYDKIFTTRSFRSHAVPVEGRVILV